MTKRYYSVSPIFFILLTICTFGIYEIYWAYKNWSYIKERDNSKISPFWRAVFIRFWYYALLKDLTVNSSNTLVKRDVVILLLAISYFIIGALWKLEDPYWLLSFLSFLPLLPGVLSISHINSTRASKRHVVSWLTPTFIIGLPLFIFTVLSSINYLPSTSVVLGEDMWSKDIKFLKDNKLLDTNEEIVYFYSGGLLSIEGDGQFISNCCVTSYSNNTENNELYADYASYKEIKDISVTWSSSDLDDTILIVHKNDGSEIELWLSRENKGDKLFINELKRRLGSSR